MRNNAPTLSPLITGTRLESLEIKGKVPRNWHSLVTHSNESCSRWGLVRQSNGGQEDGEAVDGRNHNTAQLTIDLSHKKNWLSGREQRRVARNQKYEQATKKNKIKKTANRTRWLLTFFRCWFLFSANVLHVNILLVITIHRQM